jgi:hypothetical protein
MRCGGDLRWKLFGRRWRFCRAGVALGLFGWGGFGEGCMQG